MDNNQSVEDFHFFITANQPIVFSAAENPYGPPFGDNRAGSLVCWAQDEWDAKPRVLGDKGFNHLYGYAMLNGGASNVFYNAYAFTMKTNAGFVNNIGENQWEIPLDGTHWDWCPQYLITSFLPAVYPTGTVIHGNPDLALWPCKQDLRQDREPTCTKAKFDIWDYNEWKYTGSYQCFKCFFEGFLHRVGDKLGLYGGDYSKWVYKRGPGFGGEKFLVDTLGENPEFQGTTLAGWTPARLRITGVKSDKVCVGTGKFTGSKFENITCTTTVNSGLLGVLLYADDISGFVKTMDGFAPGVIPHAAYTLHGAGTASTASTGGPGFVKYDGSGETVPESANR